MASDSKRFSSILAVFASPLLFSASNDFSNVVSAKILSEEDPQKQAGWIALLVLAKEILETCIELLGFFLNLIFF